MWLMLEEGDGHQISLAALSNSTELGITENRAKHPLQNKQKDKDLFIYAETFLSCNAGACPEPSMGECAGDVF